MLDKQFDHIIRKKVEEAKPLVPAPDWNKFSSKLDVDNGSGDFDDAFDAAIVSKIADAKPVIPVPNWSTMTDELGHENNTPFDESIKEKVSQLDISIPAPNWSTLASKLGHENNSDFDKTIKDKISDPDVAIPVANWEAFKSSINSDSDLSFDDVIKDKVSDPDISVPTPDWDTFKTELSDDLDPTFDKAIKDKIESDEVEIPKPAWAILAASLGHSSSAAFDKAINNKITDPDITIPESDWGAMASALGHEDHSLFDNVIKDKVTNPNVIVPPSDWGAIAGALGYADNGGFDNVIKDKVDQSEINVPQADWDNLSKKMHQNETAVDQSIKSKLKNVSANYNENHWAILRDRLKRASEIRQVLYPAKAFEGMLALLLLLTLFNYYGYVFNETDTTTVVNEILATTENIIEPIEGDKNKVKINATANVDIDKNQPNAEKINSKKIESKIVNPENTVSIEHKNVKVVNGGLNEVEIGKTNLGIESSSRDTAMSLSVDEGLNSDSGNNGTINTTGTIKIVDEVIYPNSSKSFENGTDDLIPNKEIEFQDIVTLDPLTVSNNFDIESRDFYKLSEAQSSYSIKEDTNVKVKKSNLFSQTGNYLNGHIGYQYNIVNSPRDERFAINNQQSLNTNLHGAIGISKIDRNLEYGIAIDFRKIEYSPVQRSVEYINLLENTQTIYSFNKINYNIVSIPVFGRWHHNIFKNLSVFADLGISGHVITNTSYNIDVKVSKMNGGGSIPINQDPDDKEDLTLFDKNFHPGLFDGAKAKDVFYASINSGAGLQYQLNDNYAIYSRAGLSQVLGNFDFGPNNDKINTFGFQFGIKYKVK